MGAGTGPKSGLRLSGKPMQMPRLGPRFGYDIGSEDLAEQIAQRAHEGARTGLDQGIGKIEIRVVQLRRGFARAEDEHRRFRLAAEQAEILGAARGRALTVPQLLVIEGLAQERHRLGIVFAVMEDVVIAQLDAKTRCFSRFAHQRLARVKARPFAHRSACAASPRFRPVRVDPKGSFADRSMVTVADRIGRIERTAGAERRQCRHQPGYRRNRGDAVFRHGGMRGLAGQQILRSAAEASSRGLRRA